jgi:hypothetical protein
MQNQDELARLRAENDELKTRLARLQIHIIYAMFSFDKKLLYIGQTIEFERRIGLHLAEIRLLRKRV